MKKRIARLKVFTRRIGRGLKVEFDETIEIPSLLKQKEYKKAGAQVVDIFKMAGLTVIWVVPGGAVLTAVIIKFSHKARPSAFNQKEKPNREKSTHKSF